MPLDTHSRLVTLSDVIERIQADDTLRTTQKRDWCSSVRSFVRFIDRDLTVEASPGQLRNAFKKGPPPGTNRKTWSNTKSNTLAAMRHCGCVANNKTSGPTKSDWDKVRGLLSKPRFQRGLSRFANWCSREGIHPDEVNQEAFDRFFSYLTHQTLLTTPESSLAEAAQLWNRAVENVDGWPQTRVSVPCRRTIITLGEDAFSETFRNDLDAWQRRASGKDFLNSERQVKVLRPATLRSNRATYVRCASILVRHGIPVDSITSLKTLVESENSRTILEDHFERHDHKLTRGLEYTANLLAGLGRNWIRLNEEDQAELDSLAKKVAISKQGMSDKSKTRLRQFEDDDLMARFIDLPWIFRDQARQIDHPVKAARKMRLAVVVGLALCAPVRRRNIVELHLDHHFSLRRQGRNQICHLHYSAHEVKNKVEMDFLLNPYVTKLFIEYRDQYRPQLLKNNDDRWLFPGEKPRKHLTPEQLSQHLCRAIKRELGVEFNLHLFRHLAAKIYLEHHPDDFVTVQQLLGHKHIQTTIDFYCDFDRVKALSRYDAALFGERP